MTSKQETGMPPITLEFDARIYKPRAIAKAVKAFENVMQCETAQSDGSMVVNITHCLPEYRDVIAYEFSNFALWMIRN